MAIDTSNWSPDQHLGFLQQLDPDMQMDLIGSIAGGYPGDDDLGDMAGRCQTLQFIGTGGEAGFPAGGLIGTHANMLWGDQDWLDQAADNISVPC